MQLGDKAEVLYSACINNTPQVNTTLEDPVCKLSDSSINWKIDGLVPLEKKMPEVTFYVENNTTSAY